MASWTKEDLIGNPAVKRTLAAKQKLVAPAATVPAVAPQTAPQALSEPKSLVYASTERMAWVVKVCPIGAVRMTQSDKWRTPRRKCVQAYFDFRDVLRREVVIRNSVVPDELNTIFYIPMPKSWSEKKKRAMNDTPHRSKPDRDNLDKAVGDALFEEDGAIWMGRQQKWWCRACEERVCIEMLWHAPIK